MSNLFMKALLGLALLISLPMFVGSTLDDSMMSGVLFVLAIAPWFIVAAWIVIHFTITAPEAEKAAQAAAIQLLHEQQIAAQ
jgi:hypothetical protein